MPIFIFFFLVLFGIAAAIVAKNKGRNGDNWFAVGFLLGPIGLILSLVVSKNQGAIEQKAMESGGMKKCPYCAELIKSEAIKCRHCGMDMPLPELAATDADSPPRGSRVRRYLFQTQWSLGWVAIVGIIAFLVYLVIH